MIHHISLSIEGLEKALKIYKSYSGKNKRCKELFGLTYGKVKKEIQDYKNIGYKNIPSKNCKNINKYGGCGGCKNILTF